MGNSGYVPLQIHSNSVTPKENKPIQLACQLLSPFPKSRSKLQLQLQLPRNKSTPTPTPIFYFPIQLRSDSESNSDADHLSSEEWLRVDVEINSLYCHQ